MNLSTSIWVKTVSRCMKARETGMSKARMRSTLESEFQKMFWAMTSIAAAWVRWEMPTARVFSLMFSTSPPSVWNWQSRRKYSETSL